MNCSSSVATNAPAIYFALNRFLIQSTVSTSASEKSSQTGILENKGDF